jgi:predicted PurR-regulated permease PerM
MPNPILWGVLAGILNFIPYVGSATTLVVLAIVAFVSFDGVGQVLAVTGTYVALTTIEGQIVQPLESGQPSAGRRDGGPPMPAGWRHSHGGQRLSQEL